MLQLDDQKQLSLVSWAIKKPLPPEKVLIPLHHHQGLYSAPCVAVGDYVVAGQTIAEPVSKETLAVHASISGVVAAIHTANAQSSSLVPAIEIVAEGHPKKKSTIGVERVNWKNLTRQETLSIFQSHGLVDMQSGEALHGHLEAGSSTLKEYLVINGCESEPYVTCDHALMMSHPVEILKGTEILRLLWGAKKVIFALEDNKSEVAEIIKSKIYLNKWEHMEVAVLPTGYPQGDDNVLLRSLFDSANENAIEIYNVATPYAVYEAVVLQKPLYERAVTVSGECVVECQNVWAPVGSSLEHTFKFARGLLRAPQKVLINGPMRGISQPDLRAPVTATTQAVLALSKEVCQESEVNPCIRCGRCIEVCPENISPAMITLAAERDLFEEAKDWGAGDCTECGNCAYVCPAKRPMVELIHYANHMGERMRHPVFSQIPIEVQKQFLKQPHQERRVFVETYSK